MVRIRYVTEEDAGKELLNLFHEYETACNRRKQARDEGRTWRTQRHYELRMLDCLEAYLRQKAFYAALVPGEQPAAPREGTGE